MNALKDLINWLASPAIAVTLSMVGLVAAMFTKALWTKKGGLVLFATLVGGFAFSFTDPNFRIVATTPDNVPILGMLFLVGFFFWYAMYQAHLNDARLAKGLPPLEREDSDKKVFSWPDLVYVELISLVVCSIVMIVWSVVLKAPLEEPANPGAAPNPAKAPWYFLGLQELLVYFDPWMAGVVLPTLIIVGLMAIPYIDTNPRGNGYFSFRERKWEIVMFLLRVPHPVGRPHHPRNVPARAELELLRALRILGSEQARPAEQRERLGDLLGQVAARRRSRRSGSSARSPGSCSSSCTWACCPGSCPRRSSGASTRRWGWSATSWA